MKYEIINKQKMVEPRSTLHVVLQCISNGVLSEGAICGKLGQGQGYYGAAIFTIPRNFKLAEEGVWDKHHNQSGRQIGRITKRGQEVLRLLDSGKVINLGDLQVNKDKTTKFQNTPTVASIKLNREWGASWIMYYLYVCPDWVVANKAADHVHVSQAGRPQNFSKLKRFGLIDMDRKGPRGSKRIKITELGKEWVDYQYTDEEFQTSVLHAFLIGEPRTLPE